GPLFDGPVVGSESALTPIEASADLSGLDRNAAAAPVGQTIRFEAEALDLENFRLEATPLSSGGQHLSLKASDRTLPGTASGLFNGETGTYEVRVGYYDENDGVSSADITVAGKTEPFSFDQDLPIDFYHAKTLTERTTHAKIELNPGDVFDIVVQADQGEMGRIDYIDFVPVEADAGANPRGLVENPAAERVNHEMPPFESKTRTQSWGAGGGLAPLLWFWEEVPRFQDEGTMDTIRGVAESIDEDDKVPTVGLQLWQDAWERSQPGGDYADEPGHKQWVEWVQAHPDYLGVNKEGEAFNWGYVSPLTPLDPEDYPEGFEGDVAYFADWQAEKIGQHAAHTGVRGLQLSDFFDSHPHTGPYNYFNEGIIDDFERKTGITLKDGTVEAQAEEIRSQYHTEWLDHFVDGWAYNLEAQVREIREHTGKEPWVLYQASFTPHAMRQHAAIDARALADRVSPDNFIMNVQTVQGFLHSLQEKDVSYHSGSIGLYAAHEPDVNYGHILPAAGESFWKAVDHFWPELSAEAREELGWKHLKQTWLESGWTHVATRQGDTRRAAETWSRSYWDGGEIEEGWIDVLHEHQPVRPFGAAIYSSTGIQRAIEQELGADANLITQAYLGDHLEPLTDIIESGAASTNFYASDAALDNLAAEHQPTAWIVPDRVELLPDEERAKLEAIAPVLSAENLDEADHPLTFTTDEADRTVKGFGFYNQNDELIVVASDQISFDETSSNKKPAQTTVHLDLADGQYVARDLFTGEATTFEVSAGTGQFRTTIDRWDTRAFAITLTA
ncbi:MAG: hypothetical protein AAFW75_30795, partial [Cyanobacteria bacterium J06636_16]